MISKRVLKKSGIYFLGNLSSKVLSMLLLPIYAFYLNTADLGSFDFSQTMMGIITPIIYVAIWESILRFLLIEENELEKKITLSTTVIFTIIMSIVFIIVWLFFNSLISSELSYSPIVMLMILIHSIAFIWQYYARAYGRNKLYVISGILATLINFILVVILVIFLHLGLLGLLIAYTIGQLSIIILNELKLGILKNIKIDYFSLSKLKIMILFSSPLVLNLISTWLLTGFGRVIITLKLGMEANGLYSFSSRFALIVTMIGSVITMAMTEEAILSIKEKKLNQDFNKSLEGLFKVFQLISLLAVPLIVIFYEFLSNTDYSESVIYAPWFMIYAVGNVMASNLGSVFHAINKTKYQFITTIIGSVVTVSIAVTLITKLGIPAVIIAITIGVITMVILRYILINRFIQMKINWYLIIVRLVLFILVTVLSLNISILYNILLELVILIIIILLNIKVVIKFIELHFINKK